MVSSFVGRDIGLADRRAFSQNSTFARRPTAHTKAPSHLHLEVMPHHSIYLLLLALFLLVGLSCRAQNRTADQPIATDTTEADTLPPVIYKRVEQMPRFYSEACIGLEGREAENCATKEMLLWISRNLRYPTLDEGEYPESAVLEFVIDTLGQIRDITVLRGGKTGESYRDDLWEMPRWIPGRQNGRAVNVLYRIPLRVRWQKN